MQVVLEGTLRHFGAAELLVFLCSRARSGTLDLENAGRRTRVVFEHDRIVWADPFDLLLEAFGWTSGTFTLVDAAAVPENAERLSLTVAALLEEAKRRTPSYAEGTLFRVVDDPALQQQVSLTAEDFKLLFRISSGKTFLELLNDLGMPRQELAERLKRLAELGLVAVVAAPAEATSVSKKTTMTRRPSVVGSLTPEGAPDNVYPLLESEYTIGRAPSNDIAIPDGSVSSTHARIVRTDTGFSVEDLKSRNGTFINGEKVSERRLLADGDILRVGKIIMTFNLAREENPGESTQPEVRL